MKFKYFLHSSKLVQLLGLVAVICLIGYGVAAKHSVKKVVKPTVGLNSIGWLQSGPVKAKATLSQNKVVQGSDGQIYMQIDLEALKNGDLKMTNKRAATDFVVVLDRSGSMSGSKKMEYAKKAIQSLVEQLSSQDRFALVTFDNLIEVPVALKQINKSNKASIIGTIQEITPRGSTNLGGGLQKGMDILKSIKNTHAKRVILISDGHANVGITDVKSLGKMASQAVPGEFVVSSIGVGLDFNESLLSHVADFGTGSYYFLEKLAKLDDVLAKEFYGASQILAKNLKLELNLASGIEVVDASGYPVTHIHGKAVIIPGHLYQGQKKSFFVSLKVPTNHIYSESLGDVALSYAVEDKAHELKLSSPKVTVACLDKSKEDQAIGSIDQDAYNNAWTKNNYGAVMKEGAKHIRSGNLAKAKKAITHYKNKLKKAYNAAPSAEMKDQISKLDQMEEDVDDAFTGSGQGVKQKRLSKGYHYEGGLKQRSAK
jgi:Ca-activated chloride channel homolog